MNVRILAAAMVLCAGACASAPTSLNFDGTRNALLIIAAPPVMSMNIDELRRVDLAAGTFVEGGYVRVETNTAGTLDTQPNQINAGVARSAALSVQEIPAGDYARQKSTRTFGINVYGYWGEVCHNKLAPVYSLAAGEVAIIRVDEISLAGVSGRWSDPVNVAPDVAILGDFERARTNYPGIEGPVAIKTPSAFIRWASEENCKLATTFELVTPEKAGRIPR